MKDPRNTSLTVLYKVIYDRQPLQRALEQEFREEPLSEKMPSEDKASKRTVTQRTSSEGPSFLRLISGTSRSDGLSGPGGPFVRRLVRGCLEKKVLLEGLISRKSSVPLKKMKPYVRLILLQALYELCYMDTEPYAAVSEALRLAEKRRLSGLKGFINAVLRNILREKEILMADLSFREACSLPEPLFNLISEWYDEETLKGIARSFSEEERALSVRHMASKVKEEAFLESLQAEGVSAVRDQAVEKAYFLEGGEDLTSLETFRKGWMYVQDVSSQLDACAVKDLTSGKDNIRILDLCASPGGKSIDLCDDCRDEGEILACDLTEAKIKTIRENLERLDFRSVKTRINDASVYQESFREQFDLVIADVPCSGLGTIRKKPDLLLSFDESTEKRLKDLVLLQRKILENAALYVKPGGTLVYSTCTVNPEENEKQTEAFLSRHPEYVKKDLKELLKTLPGKAFLDRDIRILPGELPYDGFYVCRMEKEKD